VWVGVDDALRERLRGSAESPLDFDVEGVFVCRVYTFWNGGRPLAVIYEAFPPWLASMLHP
jgi:hypothetical protein